MVHLATFGLHHEVRGMVRKIVHRECISSIRSALWIISAAIRPHSFNPEYFHIPLSLELMVLNQISDKLLLFYFILYPVYVAYIKGRHRSSLLRVYGA